MRRATAAATIGLCATLAACSGEPDVTQGKGWPSRPGTGLA
jgi:hypothetical protein